ncbi:MAG: type II toxin-antitoxin system VapC family toxin [Paludibacter sp.]
MILIDTNILIEIYRNNTTIVDAVKKIGQDNISVSDITCAELYYGARNKKELQTIAKDLKKLDILAIQTEISCKAVALVEKYALSYKLAIPDALIAATAIYHNLALYTLNTKDFVFIEGIKLHK